MPIQTRLLKNENLIFAFLYLILIHTRNAEISFGKPCTIKTISLDK